MTDRYDLSGVDPGLLDRFRTAGRNVSWRAAPASGKPRRAARSRVAHLNDEEARVEESGRPPRVLVTADSGPVGALVLLLEIDRRGPASGLGTANAGRLSGFPAGALAAAWGGARVPEDSRPTLRDLVELARYALL